MSEYPGLPATLFATGTRFARTLAVLAVAVTVFGLPGVLITNAVLPSATGYAVVALATLVVSSTAHSARTPADADDTEDEIPMRAFALVIVIATVMVTVTVALAALVGFALVDAGAPALGLLAALVFPEAERVLNDRDGTAGPGQLAGIAVLYLVVALLGVGTSMRETVRDAAVRGPRGGLFF
jgi:hypothetical protein